MAGIGTREEASPVIQLNRCFKNKLAGIGSRTKATPTIVKNECYENNAVGIGQRTDAKTVIVQNHCHHNKRAGIGFEKCKAGESTVVGNRVVDNALVAVGINPGWKLTLSGNTLSRKGGLPPIVMVFSDSKATFVNNTIQGGGVAGIRVEGTVQAIGNDFVGTSLRKVGPPNFGVWGLKGSQVTAVRNSFSDWRHALFSDGGQSTTFVDNDVKKFHREAIVIKTPANDPVVESNRIEGAR
jgi:hypothetical protein